jgi:GT2 family glycosyltransferase
MSNFAFYIKNTLKSLLRRRKKTTQQPIDKLSLLHQPYPTVSIIILTYNNLELTKKCLESIEEHTCYPSVELIIVDNASTDETHDYLKKQYMQKAKIIFNSHNKGFSAGNNLGLRVATGDYLVILNNDTQVTPHWLAGLLYHFQQHSNIGLLGPVTNNIGNEAKIFTRYKNLKNMWNEVKEIVAEQEGKLRELKTAAFFCVMMPRKIFEEVGELDEEFGLGFFEDDDYCRRVELKGYKIYCAEDVFVHHHLSASYSKMKKIERQKLFEKNKKHYESKWGKWQSHEYRKD